MLNPNLDIELLAASYQKKGYVRIENILDVDYIAHLFDELKLTQWELCYLSETGPVSLKQSELMQLTPQKSSELNNKILMKARTGFSYYYYRSDLFSSNNEIISQFRRNLCDKKFIDLSKKITGDDDIKTVNGQLACYKPACFLKKHTDKTDKENRSAAYVFNFTPVWDVDWGGCLHMLDNDHKIIDVFPPLYNSLVIFKVPTWHSVSQVSNYAQGERYTATGWLLK